MGSVATRGGGGQLDSVLSHYDLMDWLYGGDLQIHQSILNLLIALPQHGLIYRMYGV